eukprot:m.68875 g.68875  ORF g.68875 m.68875 type:complete len:113 (+) comp13935_c1_seq1:181-519(+)
MVDAATKSTLQKLPLMKTNAGPRDGEKWVARLKEELTALITYVKNNKAVDNDWFRLECNKDGTKCGVCGGVSGGVSVLLTACCVIRLTHPCHRWHRCPLAGGLASAGQWSTC